jgi:hypothetical protein
MKYIIKESQYLRLTEEKIDFESYLKLKYPNIDNLKMSRFNTMAQGLGRKYYDPETDEWLFRVVVKTAPDWESGKGIINSSLFTRLYVTQPLYTYLKKYGLNYDYDMINWFNQAYDENVDSVLRGGIGKK